MPTVPTNTRCSVLGCKNTKSKCNSFCLEHGGKDVYKPKEITDKRKEQIAQYNTKQWQTLRQIQLSRNPLCQACLIDGKITQGHHVDHVFPWMQINKEAFYFNVFQSLCAEHHREKTHLEQRGTCRYYATQIKNYTIADYARVVLGTRVNMSQEKET